MAEEEGRFSRAISKAGGGGKLSQGSPSPASERPVQPGPPFERVCGRAAEPEQSVVFVHDPFGEVASQIRAVRARILASNDGKPPRVITVTSSARAEGKTTTALNLAAALSEVDPGRVVVLDGDLPAPGLHKLAGIEPQSGLVDVLNDALELAGRVYETQVPKLDVIPAQPGALEESTESLLSQNCARLLAGLRRRYSFVIVDTPPVLAASQACTFARHSDGTLLVAQLERTPRELVKRAAEELRHCGARVIGCVLTQRKHHIPDFLYRFFGTPPGYYYGYSRGRHGAASGSRREQPAEAEEQG